MQPDGCSDTSACHACVPKRRVIILEASTATDPCSTKCGYTACHKASAQAFLSVLSLAAPRRHFLPQQGIVDRHKALGMANAVFVLSPSYAGLCSLPTRYLTFRHGLFIHKPSMSHRILFTIGVRQAGCGQLLGACLSSVEVLDLEAASTQPASSWW